MLSLKRNTTDELEFSGSVSNDVAGGFPTPGDGLWIQKMQSSAGVPYKDFFTYEPAGIKIQVYKHR